VNMNISGVFAPLRLTLYTKIKLRKCITRPLHGIHSAPTTGTNKEWDPYFSKGCASPLQCTETI